MSTTIKLKKAAAPAAAATAPVATPPAATAAPATPAPVSQAAPAAVAAPAAPAPVAPAPPQKTKEQIEYEEFQAYKAMCAGSPPAGPTPVATTPIAAPAPAELAQTAPPVVPAQTAPAVAAAPAVETPEQFADRTMADQIRTPEDAAEEATLTAPGHYKAVPGVEGAWDSKRHAIVPRVQIVQGNGQLSQRFPVSTVLLQDEVFLQAANATPNAKTVVRFVPLGLRLQYRERLEKEQQNSGLKPRIAFTQDDVTAMGGTWEWKNNQRPNFEETARIVFLLAQPTITKPDGATELVDHPAFTELPGLTGRFCPAVYYASGVAFAYFAKPIYSASVSTLKIAGPDGKSMIPYLPKRWWKFSVETRRWGNFAPWSLIANQTTEDTSIPERDYIASFLGLDILDEE